MCLSSPPCRPHTPWYARGEPQRLRLHSTGSTIPQLGPTGSSAGSLPSSTTRWFSAHPSDSTSRWTPCPPKHCKRGLQVRLGCVQLSPSCPGRLLHTCPFLWPVRRYSHFWISARGHRLSGTLTRLRHKLPGTHYGLLRLLPRPAFCRQVHRAPVPRYRSPALRCVASVRAAPHTPAGASERFGSPTQTPLVFAVIRAARLPR